VPMQLATNLMTDLQVHENLSMIFSFLFLPIMIEHPVYNYAKILK